MIDPTIARSFRLPEQPDALASAGKMLSLRNLGQQAQLLDQRIETETLQNKQSQIQLDQSQAIGEAVRANTVVSPDGASASINHNGVVQSLSKAGFGQAALSYQTAQTNTQEQLQKLSNEQLDGLKKRQQLTNSALGSVLAVPGPQRQAAWTEQRNWSIQNKLVADPSLIPEQVPDENSLQRYRFGALDGLQQIQAVQEERRTDIQQQTADAATSNAETSKQNAQTNQQNADLNAQRLEETYTPASLAVKAAKGDKDAQAALDILERINIRERQASTPNVSLNLTPEAQTLLSNNFKQTGTMVTIPRGPGGKVAVDVINQAAASDPNVNLGANKASYKADSHSLQVLQQQRDSVGAFEETAGKNLTLFLNAAKDIPDTGVPWLNTPLRMLDDKLLGSEDMAGVKAARQIATTEIAKVTSNPTLAGTLSDSARHEVQDFNPKDATFKQTLRIAQILRKDMANRKIALDEAIVGVKQRMGASPSAQPTGSQTKIDVKAPNGKTYTFDSQQAADAFKKQAGIQ